MNFKALFPVTANKTQLFFLLCLTYILLILFVLPKNLDGDQSRYLNHVELILQGDYTDHDNPHLKHGPGYPILMGITRFLHIPLIFLRLLNALFLTGAVFFFYQTLKIYIHDRASIIIALILGFHPLLLNHMADLKTEVLSAFLVAGFMYFLVKSVREQTWNWKTIIASAFLLSYLILTKVVFNYVALLGGIVFLSAGLIAGNRSLLKTGSIYSLSIVMCIPYLIYMYNLTGKFYKWETNSGEILYFRTSTYEDEYGTWVATKYILDPAEEKEGYYLDIMKARYYHFLDSIDHLPLMERNEVLMQKSIENVKAHPEIYLKNSLASLARIFFNQPNSFRYQRLADFVYIIPNLFLLFLLLGAVIVAVVVRTRFPVELWYILFFLLVYVGGISMINGLARYLIAVLPVFFLFPAATLIKFVRIEIAKENQHENKE